MSPDITFRVWTIAVLSYWVPSDTRWYWVVLVMGGGTFE